MNELEIFKNEEFGEIRTITINNEPWFVGKDITNILGYQNGSRDINRHVDEDDRGSTEMVSPSGDKNSGNYNSGDWNKTCFSNGCFNTELPKIFLFNKPSDWTYQDWLDSDARYILMNCPTDINEWVRDDDMTDEEKEQHPEYSVTGGFLKNVEVEGERQEWWDGLTKERKDIVMSLPNFDKNIFKEITGIDVEADE